MRAGAGSAMTGAAWRLGNLLIFGFVGLARELPPPGQQFAQTRSGKIGCPGKDVGEPGFGIDIVKTTGGAHRQHDGGAFGAAQAAGEGPIAPSQGRLPFILPMSGRISRSTIVGIPILAGW